MTLAGVRSATHLLHAGGYLRHLLATTTGSVVVDYLGSGTFLGRDPVRDEHLHTLLPHDARLTLRVAGGPAVPAGPAGRAGRAGRAGAGAGAREERRILLSVGTPGIKPYLRLLARERSRPEVVVVDEGIGTYGDWRTRRDAWRRQGGREPWPTVRSLAVTAASRLLTDHRWALYEDVGGTWRVVPEVAAAFAASVAGLAATSSPSRLAVYLTQPWVEMGLVPAEAFEGHLRQVAQACTDAGLELAVRPHPAERGGRYAAWHELGRDQPAELDSAVLAAAVVLGTDSTALLNLAAVQGRPALRVSVPQLRHLEQGLGRRQRALLDTFLPTPLDPRQRDVLATALRSAAGPGQVSN
ncbi:hypothetical protein ACOCJ4_05045 [Knoellia sp. CPCC 206435]|uniref:hypothetical protein n=1 Tax=Knoellia terrae TaxID=3404797 RepID=UPI003B43CBE9